MNPKDLSSTKELFFFFKGSCYERLIPAEASVSKRWAARKIPHRLWQNGGMKLGANMQLDIWVFPKIGVPQNGWLIMENPISNG